MQYPNDYGPIYAETDLSRFPVEPWNTFSNLIFLLIFIYFSRRSRINFLKHPLLVVSLPILLTGFIGGTVYHATRSDPLWLKMDWMPIFILCLLAAFDFWYKVTSGRLWLAAALIVGMFVATRTIFLALPIGGALRISVLYSSLAVFLLLPAFLLALKVRSRDLWYRLLGSALLFAIAINFRVLDRGLGADIMPMGTHFLWHIFGGLSVFCLMDFVLLYDERTRLNENEADLQPS